MELDRDFSEFIASCAAHVRDGRPQCRRARPPTPLPTFEDHNYAFYTGLLALGLRDAYRELNPSGGDHRWISPRFSSQCLDHSLVSTGASDIRTCVYNRTTRNDDLSDHAALPTTIQLRTAPAATNGHSPVSH